MSPIQFAVATIWVFYVLGMCINVNLASTLQAHGHPRKNGPVPYLFAEIACALLAAATGALLWWWIA